MIRIENKILNQNLIEKYFVVLESTRNIIFLNNFEIRDKILEKKIFGKIEKDKKLWVLKYYKHGKKTNCKIIY